MVEKFIAIIEQLSKKYRVKPIIPDTASFIFILESPHIQELKHSAPVAGSSGKTMASVLLDQTVEKPLGLLVKENAEAGFPDRTLNRIGIMNVSNIPLQKKAYDLFDVKQNEFFFDLLEKIRTTNERTVYSIPEMNDLQTALLQKFNEHLMQIRGRTCTLVPCGRFAQKFVRLSTVTDDNWNIMYDVPHPSYNSWNQTRYRDKISELKRTFFENIIV